MDKMYLIMVLLAVTLFVVGCQGQQVVTAGKSPYIGGNKGLVAEFLEMGIYNDQSSMEEIFEGETFPIEVVLKNKGEEDITAGKARVTLMGMNLNDFTGIVSGGVLSNTQAIEKISDLNAEGGEVTLDFTSGSEDAKYKIPLTGSSYDVSVFARVIYEYKTHASVPKVCYKKNFNDKTVCELEENKEVYSSGGPIQVTSAVEKTAGTSKIGIEFKVDNTGTGDVAKPGVNFDPRYDQLSFSVSDPDKWECKAGGRENEVRLDSDGKATIICRLKDAITEDVPFTKQMDLTLSYDYREIVHKQIRVKKQ